MPLIRRLPKRGFNNAQFKKKIAAVNLGSLEALEIEGADQRGAALLEYGLIRGRYDGIKILGTGDMTKKITVEVDYVSASAREKIEAGGWHGDLARQSGRQSDSLKFTTKAERSKQKFGRSFLSFCLLHSAFCISLPVARS